MTLSEKLELASDRHDELKKYGLSPFQRARMMVWMMKEGWQNYDGIDRWIKGRKVIGTKQLIEIFNDAREGQNS